MIRKQANPVIEQLQELVGKLPDYDSYGPGSVMDPEQIAGARGNISEHEKLLNSMLAKLRSESEQVDSHDLGALQGQLEEEQGGLGPVGGSILGGGAAAGGLLGGQAIAKKVKSHGIPDWMRTMRGARGAHSGGSMTKLQSIRGTEKRSNNVLMDLLHDAVGSRAGAEMPQPGAPDLGGMQPRSSLGGQSPFGSAKPDVLERIQQHIQGLTDSGQQDDYLDSQKERLGRIQAEGGSDELLQALQGSQGNEDILQQALQMMQEQQPGMLDQAQQAGHSAGVEEGGQLGAAAGGGAGLLAGGAAGVGGAAAIRKMRKKSSAMSLLDQIRDEAFNTQPSRKYASRNSGINLDSIFAKIADEEGDEGEAPTGASGDDQAGNNENGEIPGLGEGGHEEANEGVQLPPELQHLLMMLMQHPEILQQLMHGGGGGLPDEAIGGGMPGGMGGEEQGGGMPPEMAAAAGGGGGAGAPGM